ncbi:MAG: four helix bundle protein [Flavobacteriaceae bacterium]|nr:four helix bundle protein [Flavobacteriaceae bacterium]
MENSNSKYSGLEERTEKFSLSVRDFCSLLKKDIINAEYIKQLIRSAGSVGSNYIEANDSLGSKDKKMKIRISKKEAKESAYWLKHLLLYERTDLEITRQDLISEAGQLVLIFAAILRKLES